MTRRSTFGLVLLFSPVALVLSASVAPGQPAKAGSVKIGMVRAFFNDSPDVHRKIGEDLFGEVMKSATGLEGTLNTDYQAYAAAQKLYDGEFHLGVFHGHEFAWVQTKYPKLTPLMVIHNKLRDVSAHIIVHQKNPAEKLADLRGKAFDLPMGTKEHCVVYMNKRCSDNGLAEWKSYFTKVSRSKNAIEALNDLARGEMNAVVIDTLTLENYKILRGPVFAKQLRVLEHSEPFPPPVLAFKQGAVDTIVLKTVTDGLLNSQKNPSAQGMLKMWQIECFETVPDNYSKRLANVLKDYPVPTVVKLGMR